MIQDIFAEFSWSSALLGASAGLILAMVVQPFHKPPGDDDEEGAEVELPPVVPSAALAAAKAEKRALVVDRGLVPVDDGWRSFGLIPESFWATPAYMVPRSVCETDPGTLQLLPYVVVQNAKTGALLTYTRAPAGAEERLHGLRSVGWGGHVDAAPPSAMGLQQWLKVEACRELGEEAGLWSVTTQRLKPIGLVYDPLTPVGRVHLGVVFLVRVRDSELGDSEDAIDGRGWCSLDDLCEPDVYDRLEPWSQLVIGLYMRPGTNS